MANLLSQDELTDQAIRASWFFDINLGDRSDSAVYMGDGVDDLDRVSGVMYAHPNGRFTINVGKQTSQYKPFNLDDISGIRYAYVAFYGERDKPPLVEDLKLGVAEELRDDIFG